MLETHRPVYGEDLQPMWSSFCDATRHPVFIPWLEYLFDLKLIVQAQGIQKMSSKCHVLLPTIEQPLPGKQRFFLIRENLEGNDSMWRSNIPQPSTSKDERFVKNHKACWKGKDGEKKQWSWCFSPTCFFNVAEYHWLCPLTRRFIGVNSNAKSGHSLSMFGACY